MPRIQASKLILKREGNCVPKANERLRPKPALKKRFRTYAV